MHTTVQCPKCRGLLQKSSVSNTLYDCGNCSAALEAKHATLPPSDVITRTGVDDQGRKSFSFDSSSGDLGDESVEDFTGIESGNELPLYKRRDAGLPMLAGSLESKTNFSFSKAGLVTDLPVSELQQFEVQDRTGHPDPHHLEAESWKMKQLVVEAVSSADYLHRKSSNHDLGTTERWSSSSNTSKGNSVFQHQPDVGAIERWSSVSSTSSGSSVIKSNRAQGLMRDDDISNARSSLGNTNRSQSINGSHNRLDLPHWQPPHTRSLSTVSDVGISSGQNFFNYTGHRANSNDTPKFPLRPGSVGSRAPQSKLRWEARDSKVTDSDEESPTSGTSGLTSTTEDDPSSLDLAKLAVSVKETTSVEYVGERNWRTLGSRRQSAEDRRPMGEGVAEQIVRTPSDGSERTSDMYDNPASVGDYETSETSSTTVDEVDHGEGNGQIRRHSGEIGQQSPPDELTFRRSGSRPNLLRPDAPIGRSLHPEESSSYGSPTDIMSPDNHADNARQVAASRRNSWDEKVSRMSSGASSSSSMKAPVSVRQKSFSYDYGSDPGDSYRNEHVVVNNSPKQQQQLSLRPPRENYHQQPWNKYGPPWQTSSPRKHQQWSSSATTRPYSSDPSVHSSPNRPSMSSRPMPGQLPPRLGHPPPLPPPGAMPRVICQHCEELLSVPDRLPPPKSNIQKLRCGHCKQISLFSIPYVEVADAAPAAPYHSRSDPHHGQSLLASSPDSQAEILNSVGGDDRRRSARTFNDRHGHIPLPRAHSAGNDDSTASDREAGEQAFAHRAGILDDVQRSHSLPEFPSRGPDDISHSSAPLYKSTGRLGRKFPVMVPSAEMVTEDKRMQEVTSSDSEAELGLRTTSVSGSPQLTSSSSRSPPQPHSAPQTTDQVNVEQAQEERRLKKGLKGIFGIKKSVLDMTKSGRQTTSSHFRRKVVVNGVSIPDNLVKKAEEQAGHIYPGSYWYDSKAGFWGVIGGQCLGIIPPFIDEFNHPMSKDCAGGRTGVLVNGRELHNEDLRKLSQRGLPDSPGMSYQIEIDGRVVELALGSELRSLGRLAPSVEQKGRGTGMYVPGNPQ